MKTSLRLGIVLALAAGACAEPHLGEGYGRRTRTALDAQHATRGGGMPISGADAEIVMQRHRGIGVPQALGGVGQTRGSSGGSSSGVGMSPGGLQVTPSGRIRIDAVR